MTQEPSELSKVGLPSAIEKLAAEGLKAHGFDTNGLPLKEIREAFAQAPIERLAEPEAGLNALRDEIHMNALTHNWWSPAKTFGEALMLVVSEVAEAIEEYRDHHPVGDIYYHSAGFDNRYPTGQYPAQDEEHNPLKPEGIPVELADVIIRVLDMCGYWGIDIEEAMRLKMAFNRTRESRHGGKLL